MRLESEIKIELKRGGVEWDVFKLLMNLLNLK